MELTPSQIDPPGSYKEKIKKDVMTSANTFLKEYENLSEEERRFIGSRWVYIAVQGHQYVAEQIICDFGDKGRDTDDVAYWYNDRFDISENFKKTAGNCEFDKDLYIGYTNKITECLQHHIAAILKIEERIEAVQTLQ